MTVEQNVYVTNDLEPASENNIFRFLSIKSNFVGV